MENAIAAINRGESFRQAAETYGVPKTTLERHVKGKMMKQPAEKGLSRSAVLGAGNEAELVKHLLSFEKRGLIPANKS